MARYKDRVVNDTPAQAISFASGRTNVAISQTQSVATATAGRVAAIARHNAVYRRMRTRWDRAGMRQCGAPSFTEAVSLPNTNLATPSCWPPTWLTPIAIYRSPSPNVCCCAKH